jgi:hypothetical protein
MPSEPGDVLPPQGRRITMLLLFRKFLPEEDDETRAEATNRY